MKIYKITYVAVIKQSESPLTLAVQALGMAASSGWSAPRLDNSEDPNPDDAVLEFSFDADRPSGISLPVLTPISASIVITPKNGADAIVVSGRTNSITVHASEFLSLNVSESPSGLDETPAVKQILSERSPNHPSVAAIQPQWPLLGLKLKFTAIGRQALAKPLTDRILKKYRKKITPVEMDGLETVKALCDAINKKANAA